jgi:gluconokinase
MMPSVSPRDAREPFVLALDLGSSSLRGAVYDAHARPVDGWDASESHTLRATPDGGVETDADEVTERVALLVDGVLDKVEERARGVAAAGMACFAASLVGVDGDGAAVTPVYAYSDTRPAGEVRRLRAELDEDAVHQRTGCRLHTSYLPARLLWLARSDPGTYRRVRRWMSLPEYLYLRLFGRTQCSYSLASWGGLLNRATLEWDREWLERLDLDPGSLSALGDEPLRGLAGEFARRWPALASVPWLPAVADGAASNLGSGCTAPSQIALSIGTTGAMRVVTESPPARLPPGLWCYRVDRRRALVGGALNEGGGVVAWARDLLRLDDFEAAESLIAEAEPDGHGLTVLPFLAGERSPGWNADIRAAVVGLDLHTEASDMLQAVMEAVAYRFGLIARELTQAVPEGRRVIASGGGAVHSPVWIQMIADVLDRPVTLSTEPEATSRGVAVLALEAMTGDASPVAATETGRMFEPDRRRHTRYVTAMERQRRLYGLLDGWGQQS